MLSFSFEYLFVHFSRIFASTNQENANLNLFILGYQIKGTVHF